MFKENWPLTGLVKLRNPAGGRKLRLIHQAGGPQSGLSVPASWLGRPAGQQAAQDTHCEEQCGGAGVAEQNGSCMWKAEHQEVTHCSLTQRKYIGLSEPHFSSSLYKQDATGRPPAYLSLQDQLLGEKCRLLAEGLPLLHQAWEVPGSSGALYACVRRKGGLVMKGAARPGGRPG